MSGPYQGRDLSNCGVGRLRVAINCGVLSVNIASYDHDIIKLIIFQGRPLVLIIDLHAHFHCDTALYPDSGFQSDIGLSQGGADSSLHPHCCLHPDSGF